MNIFEEGIRRFYKIAQKLDEPEMWSILNPEDRAEMNDILDLWHKGELVT